MKTLLIIAHAVSPNLRRLLAALRTGAKAGGEDQVRVVSQSPFETQPEHVLEADGILLLTPENLAYMSGAMKDFFDRNYYPTLDHKQGLPYALVVRAGNDGTGTVAGVERIVTGLRWKAVAEPLICRGEFQASFVDDCHDLGAAMAAGLGSGML
ncbi:NAD(P)H-dependent oxidoreductase [uncultured Abyssibacter sp.]|uniref:flavodoxin family protein n=1 Tax=uncultured Abyssibacter sp. TaxID=2320202 RepID=UPI0032B2BA28